MKNMIAKMNGSSTEEKDMFSDAKTTTYTAKIERLGDLTETLGIETIFGFVGIFKVRIIALKEEKNKDNKDVDVKPVKAEYIWNKKENTSVVVRTFDTPNYHDMSTYMTILKCVEMHREGVERKSGFNVMREANILRVDATTKIVAGKREFCRILGISYGARAQNSIKGQLDRLRNTTITIEKGNDVQGTYNLLDNYSTTNGKITVSVNNKLLDMCQARNHRIHWEAIRALKGQVEKGLLLYLDCHNFGPESPIWEHLLIRFLYGLERPAYVEKRKGDVEAQEKMITYEKQCIEYRRQIKKAYNVLKNEGLIKDWAYSDKDVKGRTMSRHYMVDQGYKKTKRAKAKITTSKYNVIPLKKEKSKAAKASKQNAKVSKQIDEQIPF